MWAMMPMLRSLVRSRGFSAIFGLTIRKKQTTEAQRHRDKTHRESKEEQDANGKANCLALLIAACSVCLVSVSLCLCGLSFFQSPGEVSERLVRLRHFDGVFAF